MPRCLILPFRMFFLIAFLALLGACNPFPKSWSTQEGYILDYETGKPLENAIIVALWQGTGTFTNTICFHVETTKSDVEGKYKISAFRNTGDWKNLGSQEVIFTVYKAGYVSYRSDESGNRYLKHFIGTRRERLEYLIRLTTSNNCHSAGILEKKLYILYRALYEESKYITEEKENYKDIVNRLREAAASKAVSDREYTTYKEKDVKIKEFMKEHLK